MSTVSQFGRQIRPGTAQRQTLSRGRSKVQRDIIRTNWLIFGGVFGDTPGRANVWIWGSFWGGSRAPLLRSRGCVTYPAPSPPGTKDEHSFTVWTSIRAWHSAALGDGTAGGGEQTPRFRRFDDGPPPPSNPSPAEPPRPLTPGKAKAKLKLKLS